MGKVVISDESVNCYGCIVLTSGIDFSQYLKNPVLLFNHNMDKPIGTMAGLEVNGTQLLADDPKFYEKDAEAKLRGDQYADGVVKGFSANLEIQEVRYDVAGHEGAPVVSKSVLNEITLTPLPGNRNALKLTNQNGEVLTEKNKQMLLSQYSQNQISMDKVLVAARTVLKLDASATEDQVITKLQAMAAENDTIASLKQERDTLKGEKEAMQLTRQNDLVESAIAANKITSAQKEDYLKLAKGDFDSTKKILDGMKPHSPVNTQLNLSGGGAGAPDGRESWTWDDFHKKDAKALQLMRQNDKERFRKLFNDKFGKDPVE